MVVVNIFHNNSTKQEQLLVSLCNELMDYTKLIYSYKNDEVDIVKTIVELYEAEKNGIEVFINFQPLMQQAYRDSYFPNAIRDVVNKFTNLNYFLSESAVNMLFGNETHFVKSADTYYKGWLDYNGVIYLEGADEKFYEEIAKRVKEYV